MADTPAPARTAPATTAPAWSDFSPSDLNKSSLWHRLQLRSSGQRIWVVWRHVKGEGVVIIPYDNISAFEAEDSIWAGAFSKWHRKRMYTDGSGNTVYMPYATSLGLTDSVAALAISFVCCRMGDSDSISKRRGKPDVDMKEAARIESHIRRVDTLYGHGPSGESIISDEGDIDLEWAASSFPQTMPIDIVLLQQGIRNWWRGRKVGPLNATELEAYAEES
jgi:hypothetical protein